MAAQSGESACEDLASRPNLLYTSGTTGRPKALQSAMSLQQLSHSNNAELFGGTIDPGGANVIRRDAKGDAWDVG